MAQTVRTPADLGACLPRGATAAESETVLLRGAVGRRKPERRLVLGTRYIYTWPDLNAV